MIHHLSIPATQPQHVANVLAELLGGSVSRFGPYRDSYIAWAGDEHGTAFEVMPVGTELFPDLGAGHCDFRHNPAHSGFVTTHAALSVKRTKEEIIALAERQGWRAWELSRGSFRVIEFWVENRVMIEVLTTEMAAEYLAATASIPAR
jgi:hypothetical protein